MLCDLFKLKDRVTAVLVFSEHLLEGSYGPLEPRQKKALAEVVRAAHDLKEMVRDLEPDFTFD